MSETARPLDPAYPAAGLLPGTPGPSKPRPGPGAPPSRQTQAQRHGPGWTWFGWVLAVALALLAHSTLTQLDIQRRLLTGSRELEQLVAAARETTAALNTQMTAAGELATATAEMDSQLLRVTERNRSIQLRLATLEHTVGAILQSVQGMGNEAAHSRELLQQIAAESEALHQVLLETWAVSADLNDHLTAMVAAQEAIGADLGEMVEKTRLLDRFTGGG